MGEEVVAAPGELGDTMKGWFAMPPWLDGMVEPSRLGSELSFFFLFPFFLFFNERPKTKIQKTLKVK